MNRKRVWLTRKILSVLAWITTAVIMLILLPYSAFSYVVCVIYTARILFEILYIGDFE